MLELTGSFEQVTHHHRKFSLPRSIQDSDVSQMITITELQTTQPPERNWWCHKILLIIGRKFQVCNLRLRSKIRRFLYRTPVDYLLIRLYQRNAPFYPQRCQHASSLCMARDRRTQRRLDVLRLHRSMSTQVLAHGSGNCRCMESRHLSLGLRPAAGDSVASDGQSRQDAESKYVSPAFRCAVVVN